MPSAIPAFGALGTKRCKKPLTGFKRNETTLSQVGLRGFVFHVTYMECHSVCSWAFPALSFQVSLVASENRHTGFPDAMYLISGSLPRLPIKMTLFTLLTDFLLPQRLLCFKNSCCRLASAQR